MKRILLVSPFPPYIGGVSVSVQRLAEYLNHKGYEVVKFNTQIDNRKYNFKIFKFLKYLFLPFYIGSNKRFDVIHFHVSHVIPKLYVSLWRPFFPKTRFVITIHGQIRNLFKTRAGRFALSRFDKIILVAKGDTQRMPEELRNKSVEIPAFIPPFIPPYKTNGIPDDLNRYLKRDTFKILMNGSVIVNEKYNDLYGFKDAISLLKNLRDKNMNVDMILVVMGDSHNHVTKAYLEKLKKYSADKRLTESLYWVEGVNMDLWPLLKKVNLLLRPTKSDGDALSIRESLYLNVPVLSSNVVPRPGGAVVYEQGSEADLMRKAVSLIEKYDEHLVLVSKSEASTNFADKIIEQYGFDEPEKNSKKI